MRIRLDEPAVARTRIAISPLTEMITALELLHHHGGRPPWPYSGWAQQARDVLRAMPGAGTLDLYGQLIALRHRRGTPDLFEPVPEAPGRSLEQELLAFRQTPQALVDAQFGKHFPDGVPVFLEPYQRDRSRSFGRLADQLAAFWPLAMEPYWPALRTALDEDVLLRARSMVAAGPESVLAGLQANARWETPVLSLDQGRGTELAADGRRLLLVPSVFAAGKICCSTDHPTLFKLRYQARGSAVLAPTRDAASGTDGHDRLARLLGERRARVLRALTRPATTSGLAARLDLPPSTVSEQLAALLAAKTVQRRRSGRRVFYSLEPAGDALLSLFGSGRPDDSPPPN